MLRISLSDIQMIQIRPQSAPNLQCAYACPMNNLTNLYTKLLPTCKKCAQVLMKQLIKHEDACQIKHVYVSLVVSVHVC
jgi:hypothetical protein